MYRPVSAVEVRMWNGTVGAAAFDPAAGCFAFEYAPAFLRTGIEPAPLTMPAAGAREPYIFPNLPKETFHGLPAMLADSLPDRFGNALINAYMARQGVSPDDITPLDRLAYMSKRAMGALEYRPARGPQVAKSTALDLADLVETARKAVQGDLTSRDHTTSALMDLIQVGTSAGGARAKATLALNPDTREIRAGQFDAPAGFEHWLLKFDGIGADRELGSTAYYGRIEYAYHLMAIEAGIDMSHSLLLEEGGRAHFMTRRFDRTGNQKHHTQTLCAMAHLDYNLRATHDLSQFIQTVDALGLGTQARRQALLRAAFNIAAANCDDHTKNQSFILKEGESWQLAPAYDITFAYNPAGAWTYQHLMSVNGKYAGITRNDLLSVADRFLIPDARALISRVNDVVARWPDFAALAGLPAAETERISRHLTTL